MFETQALASYVVTSRIEDIPSDVRHEAKRALVNYVGCAIGGVTMEAVSRSILVFYIPMLVVLLLVTYVPALTLWLPSLFK